MKQIILASQSPRRKQLLELAEIDASVNVAAIDETYPESLSKNSVASYLAAQKANVVWDTFTEHEQSTVVLIASDTIVLVDDIILGKPKDAAEALYFLKMLNNRMHFVITGVCIKSEEDSYIFDDIVEVYFKDLSEAEMKHYIDKYQPFDKAGAYAIQEWIGAVGIERINGDYYSVMGLPVQKVRTYLLEQGYL